MKARAFAPSSVPTRQLRAIAGGVTSRRAHTQPRSTLAERMDAFNLDKAPDRIAPEVFAKLSRAPTHPMTAACRVYLTVAAEHICGRCNGPCTLRAKAAGEVTVTCTPCRRIAVVTYEKHPRFPWRTITLKRWSDMPKDGPEQ
jgi:hypothetical protein